MLKVNNKKVIKKLAISSFRKDKLRNIFAIIAITLTTILFTSLFTIGTSLLVSLQHSTMRQVGGSSHGTFKNISKEEYEKINDTSTVVLDIIDPSIFNENESIIEVIIASMFKNFKKQVDNEEIEYTKQKKLLIFFQKVFRNLKVLHQDRDIKLAQSSVLK